MVQLLRLTKTTGKGDIWINPDQIIYAEVGDKKEGGKVTILHVSGKEGKVFVKESPEELNKIFEKYKKEIRLQY